MVRDLARELPRPSQKELHFRDARQGCDDLGYRSLRETLTLEKLPGISAEAIQMTRAARVRCLARRRDQRSTDSTPTHRFIYIHRAYQRRVNLRLDPDHS